MSRVRLFICGDIVNSTPGVDFVEKKLIEVIKGVDYSICNLEGPELYDGSTGNFPHQEKGTIHYLANVGFNLFLLANNHITELGESGVRNTINTIKHNGADYIGAGLSWEEAYRPLIRNVGGKKLGLVNICEAQVGQYKEKTQAFGYAWMGYDRLFDDVKDLSLQCDIVAVFVHAGLEHYIIPLPEIRIFYKKLCDAGASFVIGGHTHTAQGYEYYNNSLILYSLGNFYFPQSNRENENKSYSIILDIEDNGRLTVTPVFHSSNQNIVFNENLPANRVALNDLCNILNEEYEVESERMCIKAYDNLCSRLLAEASYGVYNGQPYISWLKQTLQYILFHKRYFKKSQLYRDALMLRLFENESYRWTIINALKSRLK